MKIVKILFFKYVRCFHTFHKKPIRCTAATNIFYVQSQINFKHNLRQLLPTALIHAMFTSQVVQSGFKVYVPKYKSSDLIIR